MTELLATSATKEGIIKQIESFWYRKDITLISDNTTTKEVYKVMVGTKLTDFTVTKKGSRYRFEG